LRDLEKFGEGREAVEWVEETKCTFCKTNVKLEQATKERRKMLVDGNLQTFSFVCIQPEIFSSSIPLEMRAHPFGLFWYLGSDRLRIPFLTSSNLYSSHDSGA